MSKNNRYILEYVYFAYSQNQKNKTPEQGDALLGGIPLIPLEIGIYLGRKERDPRDQTTLGDIRKDLLKNHVREEKPGYVRIVGYDTGHSERVSSFYIQCVYIYTNMMKKESEKRREHFLRVMMLYPFFAFHTDYDRWKLEPEWQMFFKRKLNGMLSFCNHHPTEIEKLSEMETRLKKCGFEYFEQYISKKEMYSPQMNWTDMIAIGYNRVIFMEDGKIG